jgi:hypothetical protein
MGNAVDAWPLYLLQELLKNPQVIIFESRGVGNATAGKTLLY